MHQLAHAEGTIWVQDLAHRPTQPVRGVVLRRLCITGGEDLYHRQRAAADAYRCETQAIVEMARWIVCLNAEGDRTVFEPCGKHQMGQHERSDPRPRYAGRTAIDSSGVESSTCP